MKENIFSKFLLSKYLFAMATDCFDTDINMHKIASGMLLLQDSVEIFLVAFSEQINVDVIPNQHFDQYFKNIKEKLGRPLELEGKMKLLNKQRVNIKHYGLLPNIEECKHFIHSVSDFFDTCSELIEIDWTIINLLNLIRESYSRNHLVKAEQFLKERSFEHCFIECRKAIYLEFEKPYNIKVFKDGLTRGSYGLNIINLLQICKAPEYARNKEYIEKNVKNPTDFIVIDNAKLDFDLLKIGVNLEDYNNVIRLTPSVFYDDKIDDWIIKEEFLKYDDIQRDAEYVFYKTLEIIFTKQKTREKIKTMSRLQEKIKGANIKTKEVKFYEKADKESRIITTFKNIKSLIVKYKVKGLDGNIYYCIDNMAVSFVSRKPDEPLEGFIAEEDVEKIIDVDNPHYIAFKMLED